MALEEGHKNMTSTRYQNPAMKQLTDQQVRYAPREVRLAQINKAERFLEEIDPQQSYRYREICERITAYRPEMYPSLILPGAEAAHDLRCFVEDLSESMQMRPEQMDERVLTVDEVKERYNVSAKTIGRWRDQGLVSRRFVFGSDQKKKRIGFLESSVEKFVRKHAAEVARSSRFSQISDEEREQIIYRARRLARTSASMMEISRRLANKFNRSPEAIRYTLKKYDQAHPELAVFPSATSPLTEPQRKEIYQAHLRGVPVARLQNQYGRTRSSIHRIISEVRAKRLVEQVIDYIDNELFWKKNADSLIFGPPPEVEGKAGRLKAPPGLPPYLASLYSIPLLTREEEVYYFRKMNYLKHKASELRKELNPDRPKAAAMDQIEEWMEASVEIKNFLIRSNLRLVVSIAKRHIRPGSNFFEMVSDGNMSLIRAIEKFDFSKGNKFSTYATWAIMKNFARSIPAEHTVLDRFRTGREELFEHSLDNRGDQFQEELVNQKQHQLIMGILDQLDDREKEIIVHRFGLSKGSEPLTLEEVGQRFGVTKERIRQLESRALKKLRKIAHDDKLDIPGV